MKKILVLFIILNSKFSYAQKSTTELPSTHRILLANFLAQNSNYSFIPETWMEQGLLKVARTEWGYGLNFKPYYKHADFNKDGIKDFAILLLNNNIHNKCVVVIFNGQKNSGYKLSHVEDEDYDTSTILAYNDKKLHIKILETESDGCFIPAGNRYIVEPCGGEEY
ncbi:MAG: hypothetical protein FGM54_05410 [Chitinophagaceae bacterium]|nr:hypothetical protein [Chitinophagaceae bacterium]